MPAPIADLSFNTEEIGIMLGSINEFNFDELEAPKKVKRKIKSIALSAYQKLSSKQTQFTIAEIGTLATIIDSLLYELSLVDSKELEDSELAAQYAYYKNIYENILFKLNALMPQEDF